MERIEKKKVLELLKAKAAAIREAGTYRGRVNQQADMTACFIDDLIEEIKQMEAEKK